MRAGSHPKKLAVEHVGKPGQGNPIRVGVGEGPGQSSQGKAPLDLGIVGYIKIIIEIDELMVSELGINGGGCQDQEEAGDYFPMTLGHTPIIFSAISYLSGL